MDISMSICFWLPCSPQVRECDVCNGSVLVPTRNGKERTISAPPFIMDLLWKTKQTQAACFHQIRKLVQGNKNPLLKFRTF